MNRIDPVTTSTCDIFRFLYHIKSECSYDSRQTAKKLMELGCPLSLAVILRDATIIDYMLNDSRCDSPTTALLQAIACSNLEIVELLVERGADVNSKDIFGKDSRLFSFQLSDKRVEILKYLLERGARLNVDAMTHILYYGKEETIRMLLQYCHYLDFVTKDQFGCNLLHSIVANENFDPVNILRGRTLDIDAPGFRGSTALMTAAYAGHAETVEYLLVNGAKVNAADDVGDTALMKPFYRLGTKKQKKYVKIIELLLQYGADPQCKNCLEIFVVLISNRFLLMKPYLAHLALIESLGVSIKDVIYEKIYSNSMNSDYFSFCRGKIEKMKRTVVYHSVTLFKLLTASEETMMKLMQNEELLERFKAMMYSKRSSSLYYYNLLRRRFKKAMRVMILKKSAFEVVSEIQQLENNSLVLEKIINNLNIDDLEILKRAHATSN